MESSDKEEDISNGPDMVSLKSMMKGPGGFFVMDYIMIIIDVS